MLVLKKAHDVIVQDHVEPKRGTVPTKTEVSWSHIKSTPIVSNVSSQRKKNHYLTCQASSSEMSQLRVLLKLGHDIVVQNHVEAKGRSVPVHQLVVLEHSLYAQQLPAQPPAQKHELALDLSSVRARMFS